RTDARVIAATNADLEQRVAAGRFRRDLYFRLNVFAIRLPPLRDRGDDIDLLTDFYLARFSREFHRPSPVVPSETRTALRRYPWPGNVRELQSTLKQGVLRMTGAVLFPEFLSLPAAEIRSRGSELTIPGTSSTRLAPGLDWSGFISDRLAAGSRDLYAECLELLERQLLGRILEQTGGNQLR